MRRCALPNTQEAFALSLQVDVALADELNTEARRHYIFDSQQRAADNSIKQVRSVDYRKHQ